MPLCRHHYEWKGFTVSLRRMCRKRERKMSLRDPVFAQFSAERWTFIVIPENSAAFLHIWQRMNIMSGNEYRICFPQMINWIWTGRKFANTVRKELSANNWCGFIAVFLVFPGIFLNKPHHLFSDSSWTKLSKKKSFYKGTDRLAKRR